MCNRIAVLTVMLLPILVFASSALGATKEAEPFYFYRIDGCDGSAKFVEQTADDAKKLEKELSDQYKDLTKAWTETKKKWTEIFGSAPFPLPKPNPPSVVRLARVPSTPEARADRLEKYQHTLDLWNVCDVRTHKGKRSFEVIRRDRMEWKLAELMKEYVQAAMDWKLAHKDAPEKAKEAEEDKPLKPSVTVIKDSFRDVAEAEKLAGKLNEKLDQLEEKKAAEEEKRRQSEEQKKQAEEAKKQGEAAGGGAANPGGN